MEVMIASDHAGVELKELVIKKLPDMSWKDLGPATKDSVDYPDYADKVASQVQANPERRGVLICGSGQGMAMRANKYSKVRAALVWEKELAALARQHNDANILCLPARFISTELALECIRTFFATPFEGGRHSTRVDKVSKKIEG